SQLLCFRLKELKDVLGHLGLSKSGKKQVLVGRIEALLSSPSVPFNGRVPTITPTQVAEFIQDTYRRAFLLIRPTHPLPFLSYPLQVAAKLWGAGGHANHLASVASDEGKGDALRSSRHSVPVHPPSSHAQCFGTPRRSLRSTGQQVDTPVTSPVQPQRMGKEMPCVPLIILSPSIPHPPTADSWEPLLVAAKHWAAGGHARRLPGAAAVKGKVEALRSSHHSVPVHPPSSHGQCFGTPLGRCEALGSRWTCPSPRGAATVKMRRDALFRSHIVRYSLMFNALEPYCRSLRSTGQQVDTPVASPVQPQRRREERADRVGGEGAERGDGGAEAAARAETAARVETVGRAEVGAGEDGNMAPDGSFASPQQQQQQHHHHHQQQHQHQQQQQQQQSRHGHGHGSSRGVKTEPGGGGRSSKRALGRGDVYGQQQQQQVEAIRCVCLRNFDNGKTMIQCEGQGCGVWQHVKCVILPENPPLTGDSSAAPQPDPPLPEHHYCELCRMARGDPFSVPVANPMPPTALIRLPGDNNQVLQRLEHNFTLTPHDLSLLRRPHHYLQVWCVLLNDKTANRMHWPAYPQLQINSRSVRVTNRPGQQLLGANGRDDGPSIAEACHAGDNHVAMAAIDKRPFCIGVRIIRKRSFDEVMAMIPPLDVGESLESALARVKRCVGGGGGGGGSGKGGAGGGGGGGGADGGGGGGGGGAKPAVSSDSSGSSDLIVMQDHVTLNLRCPMSGSRIREAGRFRECAHMGCFDLHTFIEINQRARKWQCPVCMKLYALDSLIIDPFFHRVCEEMAQYDRAGVRGGSGANWFGDRGGEDNPIDLSDSEGEEELPATNAVLGRAALNSSAQQQEWQQQQERQQGQGQRQQQGQRADVNALLDVWRDDQRVEPASTFDRTYGAGERADTYGAAGAAAGAGSGPSRVNTPTLDFITDFLLEADGVGAGGAGGKGMGGGGGGGGGAGESERGFGSEAAAEAARGGRDGGRGEGGRGREESGAFQLNLGLASEGVGEGRTGGASAAPAGVAAGGVSGEFASPPPPDVQWVTPSLSAAATAHLARGRAAAGAAAGAARPSGSQHKQHSHSRPSARPPASLRAASLQSPPSTNRL
ncbi:unnamed protein product, partial [Closterium sp. Naga37s-1]